MLPSICSAWKCCLAVSIKRTVQMKLFKRQNVSCSCKALHLCQMLWRVFSSSQNNVEGAGLNRTIKLACFCK